VLIIAGQLTVSIDNALVYASVERKDAERTTELAGHRRLRRLWWPSLPSTEFMRDTPQWLLRS
jgi:hypothetical protein